MDVIRIDADHMDIICRSYADHIENSQTKILRRILRMLVEFFVEFWFVEFLGAQSAHRNAPNKAHAHAHTNIYMLVRMRSTWI